MTESAQPGLEAVIITGASSGIGSVTAERLADLGKSLILLARRKAPLEAMITRFRQQHPEGTFIAIAGGSGSSPRMQNGDQRPATHIAQSHLEAGWLHPLRGNRDPH